MTLSEINNLHFGKFIRRSSWTNLGYKIYNDSLTEMSIQDAVATDWEVYDPKIYHLSEGDLDDIISFLQNSWQLTRPRNQAYTIFQPFKQQSE